MSLYVEQEEKKLKLPLLSADRKNFMPLLGVDLVKVLELSINEISLTKTDQSKKMVNQFTHPSKKNKSKRTRKWKHKGSQDTTK